MKRFMNWLEGPHARVASAAGALALLASGCQQPTEAQEAAVVEQAQLDKAVEDVAKACGLDFSCEGGGVLDGRASISGVASIDAFFGSVINFGANATAVSGGIEAELAAIRADFGVAANADLAAAIKEQVQANVEGSLNVEAEPARCYADVSATLEAQARCDAEFTPGSAMVECHGSCEVDASAEVSCDASATLECTVIPPGGACEGSCSGSCEADLTVAAACSGTCNGECAGNCDVKDGQGNCAGKCDGDCKGTCEFEVAGGAECKGTCKGECTFTPPSGTCEGAIRAECKAEAMAMVMCDGRCDGEIVPPMAKAECQASAKAEARMNVECTPPRVAVSYELKANVSGEAELAAQARFQAAVKNLEVRLPRLLAAVKRAESVGEAGASLVADAEGAVKASVDVVIEGDPSVKNLVGLTCALGELENVGAVITAGADKIAGSVSAAGKFTAGLGLRS